MDLREVIAEFYAEQEYRGNREGTLRHYRTHFNHFLRDSGATELADFNEANIRLWLMSHKHLKRVTLATYDRALRTLAHWLHRRGYLNLDVMAQLPKPRARPQPIEVFSPGDVRAMMTAASRTQNPLRDKALLVTLLDTGIRVGELARLELQHLEWLSGMMSVDGKTGDRVIPFGRKAKNCLRRYIDEERQAASHTVRTLFLTQNSLPMKSTVITQHVRRIASSTNVKASKLGPHTFRHTFATEFIRNGGDAFTLQLLLGHSTLDIVRRYVHLAGTDLRIAHKRFAPGDRLL